MTSSNEWTSDTSMQERVGLSRRELLVKGGSMLALLAMCDSSLFAKMTGAADDGEVIPFLDRPPAPPDAAPTPEPPSPPWPNQPADPPFPPL